MIDNFTVAEARAYWRSLRTRTPSGWWRTLTPAEAHPSPVQRYAQGVHSVQECQVCAAQPYQARHGAEIIRFCRTLAQAIDTVRDDAARRKALALAGAT